MFPRCLPFFVALALALGGCGPSRPESAADAAAPKAARWEPTEPNPPLPTIGLRVGSHPVTAELAMDRREQATGLMFRDRMEPDHGMLFVFPYPRPVAFYMKNTRIPLTAAYLDGEGTIRELHDLEPLDERPVPSTSTDIRFVLEMNRGWFAAKGLAPGVRVTAGGQPLGERFP